jgi:formate dehydrogenase subunit gamma
VLEPTKPLPETTPVARLGQDLVLRFHPSERHMHWAVAIPFMICYGTALVLIFVYNPHPSLPYRRIVSWVHRLSGLCLLTLPLLAIARHRHDARLHAHNIRKVWAWSRDDFAWLLRIVPASLTGKVSLPHQGKFNAGEKINFMALTCTYPLLLATGLVIWFGGVPYLSWLAHFSLAAIATPLIAGHILMATVNPDTRPGLSGMITGFVDRRWASHHYHHWYQELHGATTVAARRPLSGPTPVAAATSAASGLMHGAPKPQAVKLVVKVGSVRRRPLIFLDPVRAAATVAARQGGADAPAGR